MLDYKNIINKGSIVMPTSQSYLDQIDGTTIVSSKRIKSYLLERYNLTEDRYYNLVVYGNVDNYPKCQCPRCNNHRRFIRLSVGYGKYCSNECKNSSILTDIVNKIPWTDDRRKKQSDNTRRIQLKKVSDGTHNFLNQSDEHKFHAHLESSKYTFIKRAELRGIRYGFLYYGLVDDYNFKIGITFVSIESRASFLGLRTIHLLLNDSVEKVAEIECLIKIKFHDSSTYTDETFRIDKFREIINKISEILKSA